jgi:hypothetical protein
MYSGAGIPKRGVFTLVIFPQFSFTGGAFYDQYNAYDTILDKNRPIDP